MKLKTLEMTGFKTFPEKTVIHFASGITAIVGPNGSGKSNIVDAIRWVMGETAPTLLRTKTLDDVIFSGSEGHPPTSFAEVNLILDNTDGASPSGYESYSEIQVTRRAYRDGESEFFINKSPCRLKDIVELFLDVGSGSRGYCIIEQAKVQQVVTSRPEDVKLLIEEAAGVAKYRLRRKEAIRKLESTRQNLLRVMDILGEVKRQLNSMDRQARKARRFKKLKDRMRELEVEVIRRRLSEFKAELENKREMLVQEEEALKASRDEKGRLDGKLQVLENRSLELKSEIDGLRERHQVANQEFYALDRKFGEVTTELNGVISRLEEITRERETLEAGLADVEERLRVLAEELEGLKRELLESETSFSLPEGERETLKRLLKEKAEAIEEKRGELLSLGAERKNLEGNLGINEKWLRERQEKVRSLEEEINGMEAEIGGLEGRRERVVADIRAKEREIEQLQQSLVVEKRNLGEKENALIELSGKIEETTKEMERIRSRLGTLKQLVESYSLFDDSVSFVMGELKNNRNDIEIVGVLGDLIKVEKGYEKVVEAALGHALNYILVRNPEDGVFVLSEVKQNDAGRVTLAPVNLKKRDNRDRGNVQFEGEVSSISGIIDVPVECRDVIDELLGDVLLVETLEDAIRLWRNNGSWATYVSLEGDVLYPSGVMTGGKAGEERGVLTIKREMVDLENALVDREKNLARWLQKREVLEKEVERLRESIKRKEGGVRNFEREIHELKVELDYLEKEVGKIGKRLRWARAEKDHLFAEMKRLDGQNREIRTSIESLANRETSIVSEIERMQEEVEELTRKLEEMEELLASRGKRQEELRARVSAIEVEIRTLRDVKKEKKERLQKLSGEAETLEERKIKLAHVKDSAREEIERANDRRKKIEEELMTKEEALDVLQEERKTIQSELSKVSAVIERASERVRETRESMIVLQTKLDEIVSMARESYGIDPWEIEASDEMIGLSMEEITEEVRRVKSQLETIGEVNVSAIEEREALQNRYEELTSQKEDLEKSMEDLKKVIAKIDKESGERFVSTFQNINEHFSTLFPQLFMGGKGFLRLIEDEDILEAGVEIVPQPPGKRLRNVSSLSNGEKALVGIALFMSLFSVRPAPFLFLDEVDSPLDENNVDRFYSLVRRISGDRQVILITHKKRSMELADYLYGVTMEKPGVSKVVSARIV